MKSRLVTTALLLILPVFVTACTIQDVPIIGKYFAKDVPTNQPVTLNVWGMWERPEVMDVLIKKYQESHPNVTINYDDRSVVNVDDYKQTVFTRANQEDAPDIVLVHNSWVPKLSQALAPAPEGVMSADSYRQNFYQSASQSAIINNMVYAAPAYYDGLMLVYNRKHFEEIDQLEAPTAWEEFRKVALELTIRGDQNSLVRAGAAMGLVDNITFSSDIVGLLFSQANVAVPDSMDSTEAQDALRYYMNFYLEDRVWSPDMPESATAFAQEKVSMIFAPSWVVLDIIKSRPDMRIGVAPVPQVFPESPVSWGSFWMYSVPAGSKNSAVSWDFINFLSSEEQQLQYHAESAKYRSFGPIYPSKNLSVQIAPGSYIKPAADVAPFSKSGILTARAGNKDQVNAIREIINTYVFAQSNQRPPIGDLLRQAKTRISQTPF